MTTVRIRRSGPHGCPRDGRRGAILASRDGYVAADYSNDTRRVPCWLSAPTRRRSERIGVNTVVANPYGSATGGHADTMRTATDLDPDGYPDVLIGAYAVDSVGEDAGASYLFYGLGL